MTDNEEPAAVAATPPTGADGAAPADRGNLANLDADPGHQFDQTNGVVEGLQGDDDGRVDDDGDALGLDPTLDEDQTRQRPDEEGRA